MGNASSTTTAESDNIPNTDEWPKVPAVDPYAIPSAPGHDSSPSPSLSPSSSFSSLSDELQDENIIQAGTNAKATINLADAALSVVNTTAWMTAAEWKVDGHAIRPGDLVEFPMGRTFGAWSHFGMYLGNGLLAHVSNGRSLHRERSATAPKTATTRAENVRPRLHVKLGGTLLEESPPAVLAGEDGKFFVRIDHIVHVAGKGKFRVNNQTKLKENYEFEERTLQEIFDLAANHANRPFTFNVITSNSEHYATFLRYKPVDWEGPPTDSWWNGSSVEKCMEYGSQMSDF